MLDAIDSEGRLADAARALAAPLGETPKRPKRLLDAVLAWVVTRVEQSFRAAAACRPLAPQCERRWISPHRVRLRCRSWR